MISADAKRELENVVEDLRKQIETAHDQVSYYRNEMEQWDDKRHKLQRQADELESILKTENVVHDA